MGDYYDSRNGFMKNKRLFHKNGNPDGTVILNWHDSPEEEFTFYAEAYHIVAKEAVAALQKNFQIGSCRSPIDDFRAYPVVFLYRHALELYMKAVILTAEPMLKIKDIGGINREDILQTHSLETLKQKLYKVFDVYEWDWDLGSTHFRTQEDFHKIIAELHEVDKGSHAFRYPLDRKGNASLTPCFEFNLFEFCRMLDELFPALEGAAFAAYEDLQLEYELIAEYSNEI